MILEAEIKIEENDVDDVKGECSEKTEQVSFTFTDDTINSKSSTKKSIKSLKHKVSENRAWQDYVKLENSLQTYFCSRCTFETKWKWYLKNHIKKMHYSVEDIPIYRCLQCTFQTKWKFSLINHMKIHSAPGKVKTYKCPKCDYETKWSNGLSSHMKVHILPKIVKVMIYKCNNCSYECKTKDDLTQHQNTHNTPESLYKCPWCDFKTTFRHGVNKHVKVHNTVRLT